jgi:uncharacterized protein YfaS (alpha-2-macroglobulin family)
LNTQEQGQALLALSVFFNTRMGGQQPGAGVAVVNGVEHAFEGSLTLDLDLGMAEAVHVRADRVVYGYLDVSGHRTDLTGEEIKGLRVSRRVIDMETGEAPTAFRRGGLYEVVLEGKADRAVENLLLTDMLPAGFEAENPRLGGGRVVTEGVLRPDRLEIRDDRVLLFRTAPVKRKFCFAYRMRAVFPGEYAQPPLVAESLYEPGARCRVEGGKRIVVEK